MQADIRLDDYETSWPNHVEVQTAGANLVQQLGSSTAVEAAIRKDRSTIEVTAISGTPPASLDGLVSRVIARDVADRRARTDELETALDQALQDLDRAESNSDPQQDLAALATQAVSVRREVAAEAVSATSARSRFVALSPASATAPSAPVGQWILACALVFTGVFAATRTDR